MEDKHLKGICINLVLLSLLHLFGKFKLPQGVGGRKMRKLQAWLQEEENSKLQTVAGFVVDDKSQGFAQLMGEMKKLTKVKIWCESTTDASNYLSHLSEAIKEFIERGTNENKARSLSLNMNDAWSQEFLNFDLENASSCYLSSLKLQGNNISSLPLFVTKIGGLTKLCLSFSHLQLSSGILEALNSVSGLKYLKLNATRLDNLVIEEDALGSLKRLCIVVEVITGLVIEEGALLDLEFLQLLCKDLNGFSSTMIQSLPRLMEVVGSEPVENSESSGAPPTDTALLVTTQPTTMSTQESVQVVTSEMVDAQDLMGTESAMETSPMATSTDTTKKIDVESEHAFNSESLVAPPTDMMLSMTTPADVISTGESGN
uniref:Uncharacterized protein n=1 Tax=Aegilops tauschii TaxID=37682 RepID=M8C2I5_AEGTA